MANQLILTNQVGRNSGLNIPVGDGSGTGPGAGPGVTAGSGAGFVAITSTADGLFQAPGNGSYLVTVIDLAGNNTVTVKGTLIAAEVGSGNRFPSGAVGQAVNDLAGGTDLQITTATLSGSGLLDVAAVTQFYIDSAKYKNVGPQNLGSPGSVGANNGTGPVLSATPASSAPYIRIQTGCATAAKVYVAVTEIGTVPQFP